MTRSMKIAGRAFALALAASALVACVPYYYDDGYYYGGGYGRGDYGAGYYGYDGYAAYDDCYGAYRPAYCGYPVFAGSVVIGGRNYQGLRYRDGRGGRQYWYGGGWRYGDGVRGRGRDGFRRRRG